MRNLGCRVLVKSCLNVGSTKWQGAIKRVCLCHAPALSFDGEAMSGEGRNIGFGIFCEHEP